MNSRTNSAVTYYLDEVQTTNLDPPGFRPAGFLLPEEGPEMLQEKIAKDSRATRWQDFVVPQCWQAFTGEDHVVWDLLFARQVELLGSRVVSPFLDGIDLLRLSHPGVPDVEGLNAILEPRTGWRTVAVPGLVPDDAFFAMLSERVFPVAISSERAISSTISKRPTVSTTCSATSRCSRTTTSRRWPRTSAGLVCGHVLQAKASVPRACTGTRSSSDSRARVAN
jgi:hypothetical protein